MRISGRLELGRRLVQVIQSRLIRQNLVLFAGGLTAGIGSFVYHAIAGRELGPAIYGQLASLIAIYSVGAGPAVIISVVVARYTATVTAQTKGADLGSLIIRMIRLVAVPGLAVIVAAALLARPLAMFDHLSSTLPVLIAGLSLALVWQLAIPRGILQGLQRFTALSLNLSFELIVRTAFAAAILVAGYAVSGAMAAVFVGLAVAFVLGLISLRDHVVGGATRVRFAAMAGFSMTAAAGTIGVQILYSQDVILAEHYLSSHDGGIYGGLNKIGTIVYFLTLSVSQVLFPRVVDAVARGHHPGQILLTSVGILCVLGAAALSVFAALPWLVVGLLYGRQFDDATPYVLVVGVIGLALSLNNLLVQFCMAVHDRYFVPILLAGCVAEAILIIMFHGKVSLVVADVLAALLGLLILLGLRCYLLIRALAACSVVRSEGIS